MSYSEHEYSDDEIGQQLLITDNSDVETENTEELQGTMVITPASKH